MSHSTLDSLRFPPVAGLTIRGESDGGLMSTDIGPLLLREVNRQVGLTEHLAQAIEDRRHPSYVKHPLRDLHIPAYSGESGSSPLLILLANSHHPALSSQRLQFLKRHLILTTGLPRLSSDGVQLLLVCPAGQVTFCGSQSIAK